MPDLFPAIVPVTIRLERRLDVQPRQIFNAYAEVDQRVRWSPSSDEAVVFDSHNFQVGGTDHYLRSLRGQHTVAGTIRYEHIVDDRRIVFSERVVSSDNELLAISLVTWTLSPSGDGAMLCVSDQTTSIVGSGPIEGSRYAYELMLDRLAAHLVDSTSPGDTPGNLEPASSGADAATIGAGQDAWRCRLRP